MLTKKSNLILSVTILSVLVSLYFGNAAKTESIANGLKENILAKISERENISIKDLEVINAVTLKPENIYRAKVLDKKAGKIFTIDLDSNYQVIDKVNIDTILGNKLKSEFIGKLPKQLVEKIEYMKEKGESHISVSIWTKTDKKPPKFPREMLTDQEKRLRLKEIREFYANQRSTNSLLEKLKSMGHQVLYISQYAPLICIRMPIDDVIEVEADKNVRSIYASEKSKPLLENSAPDINTDIAWEDHNCTGCCTSECLGYIPRVAVIDTDVKNHTSLPGPIEYFDPNHLLDAHHGIRIMGIIASTHDTFKGVAQSYCQMLCIALGGDPINFFPVDEFNPFNHLG
ncbi:MAG: hypothetical protein AB1847_21905 [bacterium]